MGRVTFVCVTFGVIIALGIYSISYSKQTNSSLQEVIQPIYEHIDNEDYPELNQSVEELYNRWEMHQKTLSYFVNHEDLEMISDIINRIKNLNQYQNYSSMCIELGNLEFALSVLYEHQLPNFEMVF